MKVLYLFDSTYKAKKILESQPFVWRSYDETVWKLIMD